MPRDLKKYVRRAVDIPRDDYDAFFEIKDKMKKDGIKISFESFTRDGLKNFIKRNKKYLND